jgi:hypothetical protein
MYFYCTRCLSILGVENLLGHTAQTDILPLTIFFSFSHGISPHISPQGLSRTSPDLLGFAIPSALEQPKKIFTRYRKPTTALNDDPLLLLRLDETTSVTQDSCTSTRTKNSENSEDTTIRCLGYLSDTNADAMLYYAMLYAHSRLICNAPNLLTNTQICFASRSNRNFPPFFR